MVHIIQLGNDKKITQYTDKIYNTLLSQGIEVLYDERQDKSAGEKFAEADLIGIPYRVVVSEKTMTKNCVEIKERNKSKVELVKIKDLIKIFDA